MRLVGISFSLFSFVFTKKLAYLKTRSTLFSTLSSSNINININSKLRSNIFLPSLRYVRTCFLARSPQTKVSAHHLLVSTYHWQVHSLARLESTAFEKWQEQSPSPSVSSSSPQQFWPCCRCRGCRRQVWWVQEWGVFALDMEVPNDLLAVERVAIAKLTMAALLNSHIPTANIVSHRPFPFKTLKKRTKSKLKKEGRLYFSLWALVCFTCQFIRG